MHSAWLGSYGQCQTLIRIDTSDASGINAVLKCNGHKMTFIFAVVWMFYDNIMSEPNGIQYLAVSSIWKPLIKLLYQLYTCKKAIQDEKLRSL